MIQDISATLQLFPACAPKAGDMVFRDAPEGAGLAPWTPEATLQQPLLSVGDTVFFLGDVPGLLPASTQKLRALPTAELRFGAFCSLHLARWIRHTQFCGRCGGAMVPHGSARQCTQCHHETYPKIAPAVILGLTYQGRLLVTRYAHRPYAGPALVAGYCEVGETIEATCRREAMEETGLTVTSLSYFGSQPWGLSGSLLMGFFGEVASPEVTLADGELGEAQWLRPDEVPPPPDAAGALSLTATMIQAFAKGIH